MKKTPLIIGAVVAAAVLFVCSSTYNGVIPLDESTSRTTAEVQTMPDFQTNMEELRRRIELDQHVQLEPWHQPVR